MQLDLEKLRKIIDSALEEDIGSGDITSNLTIPEDATIKATFVTRQDCVVAGIPVLEEIFAKGGDMLSFSPATNEGFEIKADTRIFTVEGNARLILAYERVALNLLQYMCGIATITRQYAKEIQHTKTKILDTRKTIPGLRVLAKYAVWIGGGKNHRFGLYDAILIKDNHIAFNAAIAKTVELAKFSAPERMKVEVECDRLDQIEPAIAAGADIIMLDNMDTAMMREAVRINNGRCFLEASGGITLGRLREIAETGVDYISVGAITHSAPSIDIGLDVL